MKGKIHFIFTIIIVNRIFFRSVSNSPDFSFCRIFNGNFRATGFLSAMPTIVIIHGIV